MATKKELEDTILSLERLEQSADRYIAKLQDDRAKYFDQALRFRRALEELQNYNIAPNAREFIARVLKEDIACP